MKFLDRSTYKNELPLLVQLFERSFRREIDPSFLEYCMPQERSVDVDSEFDFNVAEFLLQKRQ